MLDKCHIHRDTTISGEQIIKQRLTWLLIALVWLGTGCTNPTHTTVSRFGWADYSQVESEAAPENKRLLNNPRERSQTVRRRLHLQIREHKILKKHEVVEALSDTDADPNNPGNVILIYTGWSVPAEDFGSGNDDWTREHVWAKSIGSFGWGKGAGTDLHHLRPEDKTVNSTRNDRSFDDGGKKYIDNGFETGCFYDQDSWEPPDEVKGDVARMMFYMVIRYENNPDLELLDKPHARRSQADKHGVLSTLLRWHAQDSVDDWERLRNEKIQRIQGNRNPFIDHPEYVWEIWGRP